MKILYFLSDFMIPLVILYVIAYGLLMRINIFDAFLRGAKDGMRVVAGILPTLIGLMIAIAILRNSGALEYIGMQIGRITRYVSFPQETGSAGAGEDVLFFCCNGTAVGYL